jgi:hypothetical protein
MTSETDKLLNQWLEDDERQERERLEWERIAKLDEERAEGRNRVYRGIGYITRPLVYIAEAAALLVLLYWWLEPKEPDQSNSREPHCRRNRPERRMGGAVVGRHYCLVGAVLR